MLDLAQERLREIEKLLPCPFCGEAPSTGQRQDESLWSHAEVTWYKVSCPNCDVQFDSEAPGEAVRKWNERDPDLLATLKRIREERDAFAAAGGREGMTREDVLKEFDVMPMEDWANAVREKHELRQKLDAANQRNEELEIALKESINRRDSDVATLGAKERKWFDAKSMAELRAEAAERKLATTRSEAATESVAAILIAIDRLAESQRKELNGNPLTDGRAQGIRKCSDVIRQALTQINAEHKGGK